MITALDTSLDEVLTRRDVRTTFQPIVDLDTRRPVAFEALSRGPAGTALEYPDALFGAARAQGRLGELDALCRETAVATAADLDLARPHSLFVNIEPEVIDARQLQRLLRLAERRTGFDIVLEITERAVGARPAELLAAVRDLRAAGWRIAIDDVGAEDMSLTFMPLLQPDVVKLDLRLVQQRPDAGLARIMHSVNRYAESTGALILAEGIETERHLTVAHSLGASLGQGWLFGRPGPAVAAPREHLRLREPVAPALPYRRHPSALLASPFECLPATVRRRVASKRMLIEYSKLFEREALSMGPTALMLSTFQSAEFFTPSTRARYRRLAETVGFVAALGEGMPTEPVAGVRGGVFAPHDPARGEWDVVVLDAHFAGALLARDLGDDGPDAERRFEYVITYDRAVVTATAVALIERVAARV